MGLRLTLGLVLVVAGLGALLWFTDQKPPVIESAAVAALDGRSLADCKRMRWQFTNLQPIEIARGADGEFSLTEPVVDAASRAHLRQIIVAWDAAQMLATEYKDDFQGREETGLTTPEMTLLVVWPDGHEVKIEIGGQGALGTDCFVRRDGKIWRSANDVLSSMRVNIDDLREHSLFRTMEAQCTELRVEQQLASGKREVLHLQRAGQEWRMQSPFVGRTGAVAAIQFVTAVLSLRADQFLPGLVRPRQGEPSVVILVRGARGEETLSLWEDSGAAFGQLPGRTGWFQSDHRPYAAVFSNAVGNLRAKVLVPLGNVAQDLAEVVIDPGQGRGDRIHLVRDEEGADWRLVEPVTHPAHASPCNELVQAINNLHAIEFVDGSTAAEERFGLGPTRLSVAVRGFAQKEAMNVWLGADAGRTDMPLHFACRADETGTVVLVPKPAVEQLQKAWTTYCARDVLKLAVPVERLELQGLAGGALRVFRSDGAHWVQEGNPAPRDEVGEFANDVLRDLRGKAAIDLRAGPLGEPHQVLRLCRINGDELAKLRIWDRGKDQPLVVQPWSQSAIGFELGTRDGNSLRELWQ